MAKGTWNRRPGERFLEIRVYEIHKSEGSRKKQKHLGTCWIDDAGEEHFEEMVKPELTKALGEAINKINGSVQSPPQVIPEPQERTLPKGDAAPPVDPPVDNEKEKKKAEQLVKAHKKKSKVKKNDPEQVAREWEQMAARRGHDVKVTP